MGNHNIAVEREEGVAVVSLDRPNVLNALNEALLRELDEAVGELETDSDVHAIVFTGSGDRAFSAGADIHEMAQKAQELDAESEDRKRATYSWRLASCAKPTIGAINGLAYGGGAVMASSLDIRVGCERTSFKFLGVAYGRVNSTWNLPLQVGWPMAKELLFTARLVEADEAYRIGLLNHLVTSDQLMPTAIGLARLIAANDPRMVQGAKDLVIRNVGETWAQMYDNENDARSDSLKPPPAAEGFKSFLERKGRGPAD